MNVKAFTFNAKIRSFLPLPILMLKFIGFSDAAGQSRSKDWGRFDRDGKNEGRVQNTLKTWRDNNPK